MKEVTRNVTVRELYDILCAKCRGRGGTGMPPDYETFAYNLSVTFQQAPTPEFRFHDITDDVHTIYIVKSKDIAQALNKPDPPKSDEAL